MQKLTASKESKLLKKMHAPAAVLKFQKSLVSRLNSSPSVSEISTWRSIHLQRIETGDFTEKTII